MITKYLTSVSVKFNPFTPAGKSARLFLSRMPSHTKMEHKLLHHETEKPEIRVVFKDKHVMTADPTNMTVAELGDFFDAHSRKLKVKDAIAD